MNRRASPEVGRANKGKAQNCMTKSGAEVPSAKGTGKPEDPILLDDSPVKRSPTVQDRSAGLPALLSCKPKNMLWKQHGTVLHHSSAVKSPKVEFKTSSSEHSSETSSERSSESNEEGPIPAFHNNDQRILVFDKPNKAYNATDILRVLSYPHPNNAQCSKQPMRVQYNSCFLIDLTIIPLDDLSADGNGSYVNNGNSTHTYKRRNSGGQWKKKSSVREPSLRSNETCANLQATEGISRLSPTGFVFTRSTR